jgi:aerobic-type carbon monoxide dehydrogenase small subunit (CoxS/CutS family)
LRIKEHPILELIDKEKIQFFYNGEVMYGQVGDSIAAALHASGIKVLSKSIHLERPRGFYCAIGNCSSCHMTVDGIPNVKTCITELLPGMRVEFQTGKGVLR